MRNAASPRICWWECTQIGKRGKSYPWRLAVGSLFVWPWHYWKKAKEAPTSTLFTYFLMMSVHHSHFVAINWTLKWRVWAIYFSESSLSIFKCPLRYSSRLRCFTFSENRKFPVFTLLRGWSITLRVRLAQSDHSCWHQSHSLLQPQGKTNKCANCKSYRSSYRSSVHCTNFVFKIINHAFCEKIVPLY